MVDEAERLLAWYPRSRPADVEAMAGTDAERLLAWYRRLGTDGLDVNSGRRMEVQSFLVDCAAFLCDSASFGDPLDEAVRRAFRDVRIRSHNALSIDIGALARKVGETRALAAGSDLLLDDLTRRLRECDPVLLGSANWAYRAYRHAPTRHLLRS